MHQGSREYILPLSINIVRYEEEGEKEVSDREENVMALYPTNDQSGTRSTGRVRAGQKCEGRTSEQKCETLEQRAKKRIMTLPRDF